MTNNDHGQHGEIIIVDSCCDLCCNYWNLADDIKKKTKCTIQEKRIESQRYAKISRIVVCYAYIFSLFMILSTDNFISFNIFQTIREMDNVFQLPSLILNSDISVQVFIFLFVASIALYIYLIITDPGTSPNNESVMRSKYCKICDKTVLTFDHHCIWIGKAFTFYLKYLKVDIFIYHHSCYYR